MINGCKLALALLFFFFIQCLEAKTTLVHNQQQLTEALSKAEPGDTVLLSKGDWKDVKLVIKGNGTISKPIVVKAESEGKTFIKGSSNLKIGGSFMVVDGLYFTEGSSPANNIIEFRINNDLLANNCRLTNCVISNFSKPERFNTDSWIVLWGKNNRIDHCTIGDKLNGGTTLIVNLDDERSQDNHHSIDSNFFNGRSRLGSNGGEMIRVGVSRYSLTSSKTNIHHNFFYQCNGEVEVISVKSGENNISRNVFYECEGGLVLRHGPNNIVEGNIFIGNNKPYTGGVRIINPGHKVYNNLFIDLQGERFRSALGVLNGVPNSALNRYFQVKDADIHHNTFINSKSIIFGAGKDAERTLAPENVSFHHNYIQATTKKLYEDANKNGGIHFSDNLYSGTATPQAGFKHATPAQYFDKVFRGVNIHIPKTSVGANLQSLDWIDEQQAGASWLVTTNRTTNTATVYKLASADSKNIQKVITAMHDGDILELPDAKTYEINDAIIIDKKLTVRSSGDASKPELVNVSEKSLPAFFVIENGGDLKLDGIRFNSAYKSFGDVQSAITTTTKPMNSHYNLDVNNCEFYNFNEGNYACIKATRSTYADEVIIRNSVFRNNSGSAIDFSAEKEDKGIYNVERLIIDNCVFTNHLSTAINVYRGGNDESTTGPTVIINQCTFNEVDNREQGCVIKLLGVQTASVINSVFYKSGAGGRSIWFEEMSWDDLTVDYCSFYQSGRIGSFYNKVQGRHIYHEQPQLTAPASGNYNLKKGSSLSNKSSKTGSLGAVL
jgi:poly(beta-D-mannuronate) lyase